jgi:hypothetical protein
MPITCKFTPQFLSQDEFHAIDKIVMRHAFDIQNEMGRLFDETIYQNELAFRCRVHGLEVLTEGVISVEYRDFRKHLGKFFSHTGLKKLQWLNFSKNTVQMVTLQK